MFVRTEVEWASALLCVHQMCLAHVHALSHVPSTHPPPHFPFTVAAAATAAVDVAFALHLDFFASCGESYCLVRGGRWKTKRASLVTFRWWQCPPILLCCLSWRASLLVELC